MINLIIGPMFAGKYFFNFKGKSNELLRQIKIHNNINLKTIVIKSALDTRYETSETRNNIITHNSIVYPALKLNSLTEGNFY
jgi:thymidine kinase